MKFKKNDLNIIMAIALIFFFGSVNSWGLPPEEKFQTFSLGEVVVSAERTDREGPTTVTEVTALDIKKHNAANLGDALKLVPGVNVRLGRTKEGFYVTIRGYEQEKVLILLDGIPIGVPYEGLVNLSDIPVENIAKIKVIKGNASVLYGPNAMGGVVNVITKKGGDMPSVSATYQVSDYNTHHLSATHGARKGNLSYFIGAAHKQSDGWKLADDFSFSPEVLASMAASPANPATIPNVPIAMDSGKRENADYEKNSLTFTGNLDTSAENTLGLSLEYYNNEYGIPPVPIIRDHKKGIFYFPRYWRFSDWERFTVNLIDEYRISPSLRAKARVFYDDYDNTLDAYDGPDYSVQDRIGPPSGSSDYDDYSSGAQFQTFWNTVSHNEIRVGLNFKRDVHKDNFLNGPFDTLIAHTYSAALEDEFKISDRATFNLGASYDVFDKRKKDQASAADNDAGEDIETFSPQAGITYSFSDALSIHGSAAQKVRFPTMRNLYADGIIGPAGNPDLKEEKAYTYEVGCSWTITPEITMDAALFYSDIKNLINFDNIIGRFEQYKSAEMTGFELDARYKIDEGFIARMGYTLLDTRNNSTVTIDNEFQQDLAYKPDELPYRPRHKIDLDITRQFTCGLEIDLNGSYFSKQRYYDHFDSTDKTHLISIPKWLDDYFLFGAKVSQKFTNWTEIFVSGENLLNESYEDIDLIPGRGRIFWAGATIRH